MDNFDNILYSYSINKICLGSLRRFLGFLFFGGWGVGVGGDLCEFCNVFNAKHLTLQNLIIKNRQLSKEKWQRKHIERLIWKVTIVFCALSKLILCSVLGTITFWIMSCSMLSLSHKWSYVFDDRVCASLKKS